MNAIHFSEMILNVNQGRIFYKCKYLYRGTSITRHLTIINNNLLIIEMFK